MKFTLELPSDAVLPDSTCIWCGKDCKKNEVVQTGNNESYEGFELWCYCDDCNTDTFKKIIKGI